MIIIHSSCNEVSGTKQYIGKRISSNYKA